VALDTMIVVAWPRRCIRVRVGLPIHPRSFPWPVIDHDAMIVPSEARAAPTPRRE
jgi:hypothetical protein